jgi:hypothetical protein
MRDKLMLSALRKLLVCLPAGRSINLQSIFHGTYCKIAGRDRVQFSMFDRVIGTIFVDKTEVEKIEARICCYTIQDRYHIWRATHAVVANQTVRTAAFCVTVGTSVTLLAKFDMAITAETQNLMPNIEVDRIFCNDENIGSTHWNYLQGMYIGRY